MSRRAATRFQYARSTAATYPRRSSTTPCSRPGRAPRCGSPGGPGRSRGSAGAAGARRFRGTSKARRQHHEEVVREVAVRTRHVDDAAGREERPEAGRPRTLPPKGEISPTGAPERREFSGVRVVAIGGVQAERRVVGAVGPQDRGVRDVERLALEGDVVVAREGARRRVGERERNAGLSGRPRAGVLRRPAARRGGRRREACGSRGSPFSGGRASRSGGGSPSGGVGRWPRPGARTARRSSPRSRHARPSSVRRRMWPACRASPEGPCEIPGGELFVRRRVFRLSVPRFLGHGGELSRPRCSHAVPRDVDFRFNARGSIS